MSTPVAAIWNSQKVRVIEYVGHNRWSILDRNDQYRRVDSKDLTFLP